MFYKRKNRSIGRTFNKDLSENLNLENAFAFVSSKFGSKDVMKDKRRLIRSCQLAEMVQVLLASIAC